MQTLSKGMTLLFALSIYYSLIVSLLLLAGDAVRSTPNDRPALAVWRAG